MTKRFLKIGALVGAAAVALLLVSGLHTSGTAQASPPVATPTPDPNSIVVNTQANAVGGGAVPTVVAKWELPDMEPAVAGFQYCAGFSGCHTDLNGNVIWDADDDPLKSGMQMAPNLCDEAPLGTASERAIQYWIVARTPALNTLTSAWDKVYEPLTEEGVCVDGNAPVLVDSVSMCYKYQVDGVEQDCAVALGTYDDSYTPAKETYSAALEAAVDTGQVTPAEALALITACSKHEIRVWLGADTLAHHQPAGTYVVKAYSSTQTNQGTKTNTFTVLPVIGLRIDFSLVDWGNIVAGGINTVSGNNVLDGGTNNTSTTPTVKDCGNVNMNLTLVFSPLTIAGDTDPGDAVTVFDAQFMTQYQEPINANVPFTFNGCYIPCHPKELDLSVHPPAGKLVMGTYTGTLDVIGGLGGGIGMKCGPE
jgi:hypothetical protein